MKIFKWGREVRVMKTNNIYLFCGMLLFFVIFSGCAKEKQTDVEQVRKYADSITENILSAMNEDNYAKYSEHFDQAMKNAIPEAAFKETNTAIKEKIGNYTSKEIQKAEKKDQYTVTYYKAKFTEETNDVIVKVVFSESNGKMYVSGLFLDSPNLRKK